MSGDREANIDALVHKAVDAFAPGDMVTRYVLMAETIDADTGCRACVTITDDNSAPWDVYALARMAIAKTDAAIAEQDAGNRF